MKAWYELIRYDSDVPEEESDTENDSVLEHVANCKVDGFCYICQCL